MTTSSRPWVSVVIPVKDERDNLTPLTEQLLQDSPLGQPLLDRVQRAFEEVVAAHARRRAVQQLRSMEGLDLDRPEVIADA